MCIRDRQGLACVSCSYPRPDRSPLDRHPILHDWPALLAASEAGRRGADLGLLPDDTGAGGFSRSTEGTLFARVDGVLLTPSIDEGARDEIERREVLAAASALGISTRETRVGREQLLASTEAFVAGPRLGIAVLAMLDGEALPLRPGDSPAVPLLRIRLRERGEADC
ncbi:MAG: aminotransferase class IV [Candidatus Eisenbacteria bacterium]|nr:aminotransferase class IV [Candidatus Eisenbacteria bacterium]